MEPVSANNARLRPAQIIIAALCVGLVLFGVVVAFVLRPGRQGGVMVIGPSWNIVEWVAKGLLFLGMVGGAVLWRALCAKARAEASGMSEDRAREALVPLFQTGLIAQAALLEGPGLFCIVTALLSDNMWMPAWAGVSVAGLVAIFPTWATYERFVQDAVRRG